MRVNNFNINHFKSLGYKDLKINDDIHIKTSELPNGSGLKIDVKCNYCGDVFKKSYRRYLETATDICCNYCKSKKFQATNIRKYGVSCTLRLPEINQRVIAKNMATLGVEYPLSSRKILEKCKNSRNENRENYGCVASKTQIYINSVYGGVLNYPIDLYNVDIYFPNERIYFEYDGSGHDLSVRLGNTTENDFISHEKKRTSFLLNAGLKEFRIKSSKEIMFPVKELLDIKTRAFDILLNSNYKKYYYDMDTKTESFKK